MDPADFTPAWIAPLDGTVCVHCPACRELREIRLERLVQSGRAKQRFADMRFRCATCRGEGVLKVDWRDARGAWTYDYGAAELRPKAELPGYYGP